MKIEKITEIPTLFKFAQKTLPPSLKAKHYSEGYGDSYYIYDANDVPWWCFRGNPVAEIDNNRVTLFHPQYFSDIEALLQHYEKVTKKETTLKFFEVL